MGFKIPKRTVLVTFEGVEDYEGLEIELRQNVPLAVLFEVQRLSQAQTAESSHELAKLFAEKVITGWNIEGDDGNAIAYSPDGALGVIDVAVFGVIAEKWGEAQQPDRDLPLVERSPNGKPSAEPLMETVN